MTSPTDPPPPPTDNVRPIKGARKNAKQGWSPDKRTNGRKPRGAGSATAPKGREARVRYVMVLIASGRWAGGKSAAPLALEWGLSAQNMAEVAAEAKRRVAAVDDGDLVRRTLGVTLARAAELGLEFVESGEFKALAGLAAVCRTWAETMKPVGSAPLETPTFRVELSQAPLASNATSSNECPAPVGNSSPPDGGPAPDSPPSSPGS